jgi:hypothetical protein
LTKDSLEPKAEDTFRVEISDNEIQKLLEYKKSKRQTVVRFRQYKWRKWKAKQPTEEEIETLMK